MKREITSINITNTNGLFSSRQALREHMKHEVLAGDSAYRCDTCRARMFLFFSSFPLSYLSVKSVRVHVAPNCLALTLKRYGLGLFGKARRKSRHAILISSLAMLSIASALMIYASAMLSI